MREWVITNGIGGFSASTDKGGMNTRRYHGLLIAPLTPPYSRTLILSKIDESIEINGQKYDLYTNNVKGEISKGYKYQTNFEKSIIPIYTYKVKNVIIQKTICMIYEKNAVLVQYKVCNLKNNVKLNLTPLLNFRDFHGENHSDKISYKQLYKEDILRIQLNQEYNANIYVTDSKYNKHNNDMFVGMHYDIEEERGFDCDENHFIPGTFEVDIKPNEDKIISFVCSLDGKYGLSEDELRNIDSEEIIKNEYNRIKSQISKSRLQYNVKMNEVNRTLYKDLVEKYIVAGDNFIVYRDSNKLHSLLAGLPWFLDWGRDAFIAFEGILLIPKRFDIAREVLLTFAQSINQGLVPNGFSEYDGKPLYNSVDSSLLFIDAVYKYIKYTKDYDWVKKNLYVKMREIIQNYTNGVNIDDNNIYLDKEDGLLVSGTQNTQNTWMDAKANGKAITPRSGKAVEVNAMWYNALKIMEELQKYYQYKTNPYTKLADKCKNSFANKFYNNKKQCLYDIVETYENPDKNDDKIRPNQLFAIGMTYPVINCNEQIAKNIFVIVTKKLLNKYGLKTLASNEKGYEPIYKGNPKERDSIYHQGITWPWLLGVYYDSLKNLIKYTENDTKDQLEEELITFRANVANTFINELYNGNTIGSICEIYDSKYAKRGKGAFAQAWSISEVFRIMLGK